MSTISLAKAKPKSKSKPKSKGKGKVHVPTLSVVRPPRADLDPSKLTLTGKQGKKKLSLQIQQAVSDATIEQTIDGATTLTLTVFDPEKGLLRSQLLAGAITMNFDGENFTLTKINRQGDTTQLTLEDTAVNLLRQYSKSKKANRSNTTRAQFVRSLVKEVKEATIPFMCPEVNVKQPIGKPAKSRVRVLWPGT
jgi:hypothetical protein